MEEEERGAVGLYTAKDLVAAGDLTTAREDLTDDLTAEDLTAEDLAVEDLAAEDLTAEDLAAEDLAVDLGCTRPLPFPVLRLATTTVVGVRVWGWTLPTTMTAFDE